MADFTNKVQEAVGEVKQTAGDITGNDDLKAEGAADTAKANIKQGVDAVADKAGEAVEELSGSSPTSLTAPPTRPVNCISTTRPRRSPTGESSSERPSRRSSLPSWSAGGARRRGVDVPRPRGSQWQASGAR